MSRKSDIPVFTDIVAWCQAIGLDVPSTLPGFFILSFSDAPPNKKAYMPPLKKLFYQIVLLEKGISTRFSLNSREYENPQNIIFFNGPGHIYSYTRGSVQEGYVLYFNEEFLSANFVHLPSKFPFFKISESNIIHLSDVELTHFSLLFSLILKEQKSDSPFKVETVKNLLSIILLKSKELFQSRYAEESSLGSAGRLTERFRQLVDNYFIEHKNIEHYAEMLHITPGYLSESVHEHLGVSPKILLHQRILSEAKNLLSYSELSVSEISYHLGYSDATVFGKFFKRETGQTPSLYRSKPKT